MAKEKMVFFRSALGGFNRDDVNGYIEKLNAEFAERERIAKKKLEASEEKCASLAGAKEQFEQSLTRIEALEAEAKQREKVIDGYKEMVDAQKARIEELEAAGIAFETEIGELTARIESLSEAIMKSEKYDDISGQIGEIILSAKKTAEDIIAGAEKEASARRAKADAQIENAAASFNARAANAATTIKTQMKKMAQDSYASLAEKAAETSDLLRDLAAHIGTASEAFGEKISDSKTEAEKAIEAEAAKVFSSEDRLSL